MKTSRRGFLAGAAAAIVACLPAVRSLAAPVVPVAPAWCPPGFLPASGQAVSRTTYWELFQVVGTIWGAGNGVSTFNLPDLRNAQFPSMHAGIVTDRRYQTIPVGAVIQFAEMGHG